MHARKIGPPQRLRFLVPTRRSAASGNENDQEGEIVEYLSVFKEWEQRVVVRGGWRLYLYLTFYFTIYLEVSKGQGIAPWYYK